MAVVVLGVGAQNESSDAKYMYYYTQSSAWKEKSQRTITFLQEPTGDFLIWLESNATKVTDKSDK